MNDETQMTFAAYVVPEAGSVISDASYGSDGCGASDGGREHPQRADTAAR